MAWEKEIQIICSAHDAIIMAKNEDDFQGLVKQFEETTT